MSVGICLIRCRWRLKRGSIDGLSFRSGICGLSLLIGDFVYFGATVRGFFKLADVKGHDAINHVTIFRDNHHKNKAIFYGGLSGGSVYEKYQQNQ